MYKTKEFADLTGLTKETLRYYAEIGLLEPAFVNPKNHYRYYDDGSYFLAVLLVKLKNLGFTIQEMHLAMQDESFGRLESLMKEKRAVIQTQIEALQNQQRGIDEFLKSGQGEDT
ncbi:MerR family transcriptional regulator [Planococcus sp. YIM B11945]|uniref:MerR family transcriptional regulator n=1 Tax=Planococcus sp. YIM B11945 TaxID=3435410 RepID=UPI003D7CB928